MDDLLPFESPKLLIDGVKARIPQFEEACTRFLDECPKEIVKHKKSDTKEEIAALRFGSRIPGQLRVEAPHFLTDLRHSLDQAVCDAAILLGRKDAKGIYFPFGKTPADLDREVTQKCKGLHADLVTLIRSFDPHSGGDDELYMFGSLAGPAKHHRILHIACEADSISIGGPNMRVIGPADLLYRRWNDLRNELEFAKIGPGGFITGDMQFGLSIGIGTGEPPLSGRASAVFENIARKFEKIVLDLEAETYRLAQGRSGST